MAAWSRSLEAEHKEVFDVADVLTPGDRQPTGVGIRTTLLCIQGPRAGQVPFGVARSYWYKAFDKLVDKSCVTLETHHPQRNNVIELGFCGEV